MEKKTPFYKKKWFIIVAAIFVFSGFVNALSEDEDAAESEEINEEEQNEENSNENKENNNASEEESDENIDLFTVEINESISISNETVTISGDTNLLNGTLLYFEIVNSTNDSIIDGDFEIEDGSFDEVISIEELPNGEIEVFVSFDPSLQTDELQEVYGSEGQLLDGDRLESLNSPYDSKGITFSDHYIKSVAISFSGTGDTATELFNLSDGFAVLEFTHSGSSNFIVELKNESGASELVVNHIGSYEGANFELIPQSGDYLLDISADGEWSAEINQSYPSEIDDEPHSLSGKGDDVIFVNLENGLKRFEFTHDGDSNFIVLVNGQTLLVNEIGNYSGSTTETVQDSAAYAFEINADGNWTIEIE
ncbi:hypothetical protein HXA31_10565 [Salipaludibacillus agaradhaerens]|uniref:Uncharacterized protein n=1 Tax=Salipaludibacillus agaradhaerens TaxID=76935 RepID=A0A9Q4B082_SALAG|nr:hypothetical protein [Salipaludibacillus agaradhaerens]MCR6095620.1 hypothetical protein [Salipaludibacillus agaradhaerens]MCR6114820.1 hypothetical protein [Salipaludibacillus agaradhaerens]